MWILFFLPLNTFFFNTAFYNLIYSLSFSISVQSWKKWTKYKIQYNFTIHISKRTIAGGFEQFFHLEFQLLFRLIGTVGVEIFWAKV